jgi:hypothetical protein
MSSRPAPLKAIVLAGGTVLVAATALTFFSSRSSSPQQPATASPLAPAAHAFAEHTSEREKLARDLRTLLNESDPARRQTLLLEWADKIPSELLASLLDELHTIADAHLRNEARQALLYSWTSRDLVAVAKWFGTLGPAHDLQQEGRDQLVAALLQCNHDDVIAVLQSSLPPTTSQQLYGPYFRGWAGTDPVAAGAKLVALARAEKGNPHLWHDLISQVAANWVETDAPAALTWVKSLPASPAKTKAEIQTAYRWTELDPVAASAYAADAKNLQLVKIVAGKWAETSPSDALRWAQNLPDGAVQARALSGAATSWAQSDPQAAARYAAAIEPLVQRVDVTTAIASAWAFSDPQAAGAWVQALPADASRDSAIGVLCDALRFTAPDQAFTWARALADPALHDSAVARVAIAWLKQEPAAARDAITRSTLTEELKASIFAQATPPRRGS